jgi:pyruvate,orthophosphate dikinase
MVPQVCTAEELRKVRKSWVDGIRLEVAKPSTATKLSFKFGTMIEVVRACMRAEPWPRRPSSSPSAPTT